MRACLAFRRREVPVSRLADLGELTLAQLPPLRERDRNTCRFMEDKGNDASWGVDLDIFIPYDSMASESGARKRGKAAPLGSCSTGASDPTWAPRSWLWAATGHSDLSVKLSNNPLPILGAQAAEGHDNLHAEAEKVRGKSAHQETSSCLCVEGLAGSLVRNARQHRNCGADSSRRLSAPPWPAIRRERGV